MEIIFLWKQVYSVFLSLLPLLYYNISMRSINKYVRLEILVWIIIILVLMLAASLLYRHSQRQYETHKIFMSDIDGLIVGSPVKLMGVQVGYVNDIKIVDDNVYIRFVIKDKDLHLPWGTTATVEFSGMAGSRSLELYPPENHDDGENVDYIRVVNPTRLSKSLSLLYEMYNKFMDICFGISAFSASLNDADLDLELPKDKNNLQFVNFLEFANRWLDNSNNKVSELGNKWRKDK